MEPRVTVVDFDFGHILIWVAHELPGNAPHMNDIWDDGEIREPFRRDFHALAKRTNGEVEVDGESTMFCAFEPTPQRSTMRVGVYFANGRQTLRFDTVREEIELAMVNQYEISRPRFTISSERGSRTFELNAASGEWNVSKESI
ncbi:hypothetical protein SAMN05216388_103528 [Halorientalis persicus]|uniref:Uncharacterized protein n=2 Tax=Halorientalis persicus TaxID=1367881 RepID=A0A1H8VAJ5_9EURY|nr:hypothetical protein SAMN05216388_103528 [Halorientalis persicus]